MIRFVFILRPSKVACLPPLSSIVFGTDVRRIPCARPPMPFARPNRVDRTPPPPSNARDELLNPPCARRPPGLSPPHGMRQMVYPSAHRDTPHANDGPQRPNLLRRPPAGEVAHASRPWQSTIRWIPMFPSPFCAEHSQRTGATRRDTLLKMPDDIFFPREQPVTPAPPHATFTRWNDTLLPASASRRRFSKQ